MTNLSHPGQGNVVYFESERLNAGQEYWYQLKSCNKTNCSKELVEVKITVKGKMDNQKQALIALLIFRHFLLLVIVIKCENLGIILLL